MRFFSGFSLTNEQHYFKRWIKASEYTVAGFSYGAIKAFRYVHETSSRIDTLQLISPAYFQDKTEGFKRLQLKGFAKDPAAYRSRFLESCFAPYPVGDIETKEDGSDDLETLLRFEWPKEGLKHLNERGVRIEVYLGEKDAIIDADAAGRYFKPYATTFFLKNANHFLQGETI